MARERPRRRGGGSGTSGDLPAPPRVLLDERGFEYRVVSCEPGAGPEGRPHFVLSVELVGLGVRQLGASYGLTPREAHIAELLARRATNREIADALGISRHTVRHHTERVLAKLGVSSRAAVRMKLFEDAIGEDQDDAGT